ncbi:MAG: hypothetical protein ACRDNF_19540, partial [Streptosporangiaceae bacterium]
WGVEPQQLAQAIRARQAAAAACGQAAGADGWALVVLETGHATQIADAVMAALHGRDAPGRLLLAAAPGGAAVPVGGGVGVLAALLTGTFRASRRIRLRDLAAQLERVLGPENVHQRGLGEAALVRAWPPAASLMSVPVDTSRFLDDILADLSADERSHFLVKAQGAEHGELSWFFEGRQDELAQIGAWLHQADSGLLVVTGRAGAGKSALLGNVFVRSVPVLRDALARRGLITVPDPGTLPPDGVFDAVIHLSGLTLSQAVQRVADAAGLASLPSHHDRDAGVASDLDFLADEMAGRSVPFTVLADALDEAADPLDIARSLLARIAPLSGVRIVAGTRASTREAPDSPADDDNLLTALGASELTARRAAGEPGTDDLGSPEPRRARVLWVSQDQQAIGRYVTGRLRAARDYGVAESSIPYMSGVSDQDIAAVAAEVAGRGQEFLFARLAVYELIADPRLLAPGKARSRRLLLGGTHQDLFGRALHRLASHDDRYPVLMRALALARGRGIPEADGLWDTIAAALAPISPKPTGDQGLTMARGPDPGGVAAWAMAISGLLHHAAAYITADTTATPSGPAEPGTVYRLAHHTFT